MSLFQKPPSSPVDVEKSRPLDIPPEEVAAMGEAEWYARAYRGDVPQLTVRAVVMGMVLAFFLAITNVYVSLKAGWTLGVGLTACVLSFTVWTGLLRVGLVRTPMTILENNCMQSAASAGGYGTAVAVGTAVPAMLMMTGRNLPWWTVASWILLCAGLGVFMAVPMKRNMINHEKLRFPSGTAAATLLQSLHTEGQEALAKGRVLLVAALFGVLVPLLTTLRVRRGASLLPGHSNVLDWLPLRHVRQLEPAGGSHGLVDRFTTASDWGMFLDHGVALVAAGAIVGLRTTSGMIAGACVVAYGLGPAALGDVWTNAAGDVVTAAARPASAWKDIGLWYGAPTLVAFGLVTFALQFRTVTRAFAGMASERGGESAGEAELPFRWFVVGTTVLGAAVVAIAQAAFGVPVYYGGLAVFLAFLLALVAGRATGETNLTPGGPMGKIMQLTFGALMPQSFTANLMTASVTAGTALSSSDALTSLKAGYLLGAHPRRQLVAQLLGILSGTAATCLAYYALVPDASVLTGTPDHPAAFPAPGAQQWRLVAELFRLGVANLHPLARHGIAVGLGAGTVLAVAEWALPERRQWLPSATGLGLGLVLPFYASLSFFVGALAAAAFRALSPRQADRFTVPVYSGLVAGESIVGVLVAILNNTVLK
jgi:uncharacterized oligopeptide transporter (OPT) family protein